MYREKRIGVVVPAYNEENLILATLTSMPELMDRIFVVNDGSKDKTLALIEQQQKVDPRIHLINHVVNIGVGQSLIDGYLEARESDVDIIVVMAGDNQMDPADLPRLLDRLIDNNFDYVKGNRLLHQEIHAMPGYRFFGNSILTILTKFATGYYSLMDPQCGYTAITRKALQRIPIQKMTRGYGYNADILCMLNIYRFTVGDVEVRPVYGAEKSKIKLWKYIPVTSWLLIRLFFRRLWQLYIVRDFNPLVLFYLFAFFNFFFILIPFTIRFLVLYFVDNDLPKTTLTILAFTLLITFQSILFAIWMDMDYNRQR